VWEDSTTPNFTFPFSVSDVNSGIQSWSVQARQVGSATWTTVASGTGRGAKSPDIVGVEGTRTDYRVVAVDRQGNKRISPSRRVYIPIDDADLDSLSFSVTPTPIGELDAFDESYSQMSSGTFTHTYTGTPTPDCLFELIGPGSGTWTVQVAAGLNPPETISDSDFPADLPRETLYSDSSCATTYTITWISGTFGLDAVLG
jgi:hypothetical protein